MAEKLIKTKFPPEEWECERAARIKKLQGNANRFVKRRCAKGLTR